MRIDYLENHRDKIATLAAWHHGEWQHLYSDWTLKIATAELADHATRRSLPTTLVLLDGDTLLGSVSVVHEDAAELRDRGGPWLASLYVDPEARGQGLGQALVEAAAHLAALNDVPRLLLFTPGHEDFYTQLGWQTIEQAQLNGHAVAIMSLVPVLAAAE
ncbi:MAG TPA: GNAT family N-acetyltransferase [Arenimonas sp.]|uniref:GNAT family N-acetyltransferase n=1 Tax=Arenimonas sp. TaxID=1872635 RepID=UPI002BC41218|nr:GNAT family N-acetyltransferase [Arenimonas sp.]HMB55698.1 GNAT family N-acetyltransferase [Arenimonas sp.]